MKSFLVFSMCLAPVFNVVALELLDESELSSVTGQSGITVEIEAKVDIGSLTYLDDGKPLSLEGIHFHNSRDESVGAKNYIMIDVEGGDASTDFQDVLHVRAITEEARLQVDEIRLDSSVHGVNSFGRIALDFDRESYFNLTAGGLCGTAGFTEICSADSGMTVSNYNHRIYGLQRDSNGVVLKDGQDIPLTKGAEFFYRDDGNDLMVSFDYETWGTNWTLDLVQAPNDSNKEAILISYPDHNFMLTVDQIKFKTRDTAGNDFTSNPNNSGLDGAPNIGMFKASGHVAGKMYITAGGKDPEQGLTFNVNQKLTQGDFRFIDTDSLGNQYEAALVGVEHDVSITNMTFDVLNDGLWIATERSEGRLTVDDIYLGTNYADEDVDKVSMGSLDVNYLFEDQVIDSVTYTNDLRLAPQGNEYGGNKGITVSSNWSLANADIGYTDNGNTVWISGIQSYGSGVMTFDLVDSSVLYDNRVVPVGEDQFFDGIRIGYENLVGHYSIDGMKVGADKDSAELQGGTELLLPLQVFQEADFTLNGHMTLLPGGKDGDGLTINSDLHFTDTTFGVTVDPDRSGIWLDDVAYDISMRGATLDVDDRGLVLNRGLYVSNMDIGNVRFGDKNTGESLGRIVLSRLERDSETYLRSGGAGASCIGGTAGNEADCESDGGRWEDRGDQGVTIGLTSHFVDKGSLSAEDQALLNSIDPDAQTKLGWYRADGKVGIEAVGITTAPDGLNVELAVDVADTVVKDKATGLESIKTGFAVDTKVQFSRLNIDRINMNHHVGGAQPIFYGARFENVSLRANVTATPIP